MLQSKECYRANVSKEKLIGLFEESPDVKYITHPDLDANFVTFTHPEMFL